ncbi:putative G-protein coupled receptor No18 [Saccoglossus kowalevskii]|uniref:Histamine H3 receptor-like n=1 Tax=Saccoglossus kowalevskii TaxID=10224 RepID=A0ABM0GTC6_SACKO|nr:PREDICTED: histamine H3 receptor-like [Saccoglossus kowalevskii]
MGTDATSGNGTLTIFTSTITEYVPANDSYLAHPHVVDASMASYVASFTAVQNISTLQPSDKILTYLPYSLSVSIFLGVLLSVIVLITIIGNFMVILAFITDVKLRRYIGNFFLLNLAVSDFIIGLVSLPLNTAWFLSGNWLLGEVVCKIWIVMDFTACYASVCAIVLISLDRYWLVSKNDYFVFQTNRKVACMCAASWVFSLLLYLPVEIGWTAFTGERNIDYTESCEIESWDNLYYQILLIALEFVLPLVALAYLNSSIYAYIRRRDRRWHDKNNRIKLAVEMSKPDIDQQKVEKGKIISISKAKSHVEIKREDSGSDDGEESDTFDNNVPDTNTDNITLDDPVTRNSESKTQIANGGKMRTYFKSFSARRKSVQPNLKKHRKHKKAAKRLAILVGTFVICWAPYKIVSLVKIFCADCSNEKVWEFVNYLLWCNSTINPLLYAFCNRRIRYNYIKFLCFFRKPSRSPKNSF